MKRLLNLFLGSAALLLFGLLLNGGRQGTTSIEHAYADVPSAGWINPDVTSGNCNSNAPGAASSDGDSGSTSGS